MGRAGGDIVNLSAAVVESLLTKSQIGDIISVSEFAVGGFLSENTKAELTLKAGKMGKSLSFDEYTETTYISCIND